MPFQLISKGSAAIKVDAAVQEESGAYSPAAAEAWGIVAEHTIPMAISKGTFWHLLKAPELSDAYRNVFLLAKKRRFSSIAVPIFLPDAGSRVQEQCMRAAVSAARSFLSENEMDIYLVIDSRERFPFSKKRLKDVSRYINRHYDPRFWEESESGAYTFSRTAGPGLPMQGAEPPLPAAGARVCEEIRPYDGRKLEELLDNMEETFTEMLLRLIDEKGRKDTEVYKGANIDRKLFSKIRSDKDYSPKKATVLALAVSLKLSLDETKDLLSRAGYALSMSRKSDVIVQYFIEHREYDLFLINETLFFFQQPLLGSMAK